MRKSQSYNISYSLSPKYFPIHVSKFSPQQSNAYIVHGVNFCASRDQQRAGLGVAFPSAQVEGGQCADCTVHARELEDDSQCK